MVGAAKTSLHCFGGEDRRGDDHEGAMMCQNFKTPGRIKSSERNVSKPTSSIMQLNKLSLNKTNKLNRQYCRLSVAFAPLEFGRY